MKHTPGPWRVRQRSPHADHGLEVEFQDPHEGDWFPVAHVETSEDDAHLIAAAPEMLEVLKQAVRTFGDRFPEIVAVVAKAEGRE